MIRILIICTLIGLAPCLGVAKGNNDDIVVREGYEYRDELIRAKGAVASIRVVRRNMTEPKKSRQIMSAQFDGNGNMTEQIHNTSAPGTPYKVPYFKISCTYNKDGSMVRRASSDTTGREKFAHRYTYKTPESSTRIIDVAYDGMPPHQTTTEKMDQNSRLIESYTLALQRNFATVRRYEYDQEGRVSTLTQLTSKSAPKGAKPELKVSYTTIYTNHDANNIVRAKSYFGSTLTNSNTTTETTKRDSRGNVIERITEGGSPKEVRKYSYTYDSKGNWTTRRESLNGTPEPFVLERTIEYRK